VNSARRAKVGAEAIRGMGSDPIRLEGHADLSRGRLRMTRPRMMTDNPPMLPTQRLHENKLNAETAKLLDYWRARSDLIPQSSDPNLAWQVSMAVQRAVTLESSMSELPPMSASWLSISSAWLSAWLSNPAVSPPRVRTAGGTLTHEDGAVGADLGSFNPEPSHAFARLRLRKSSFRCRGLGGFRKRVMPRAPRHRAFSGLSKSEPFPYRDLISQLRRVIDAFGIKRLIWASNYTVTVDHYTYTESLFCLRCADQLSEGDKEWILEKPPARSCTGPGPLSPVILSALGWRSHRRPAVS
jgi:uncharacterized protein (TIGR03382 family)